MTLIWLGATNMATANAPAALERAPSRAHWHSAGIAARARRFRRHADVSKCGPSDRLLRIQFLAEDPRTPPREPTELRGRSQTKAQARLRATRERCTWAKTLDAGRRPSRRFGCRGNAPGPARQARNGSPARHRLSSDVPWGRQGRTPWLGLSFRAPMADAQRYEQALALCSALTRVHGTQWRRAGATLSEAQQMLERSRLFRC